MSKTIAQQLNIKDFPFEIKDKNGNQIYLEDSRNHWSRRERDSNGNKIYFENSFGYWSNREYDSNGNKIRYENSFGFWAKREYDSDNNEIRYENSKGVIIDNRAKEIITVNGIKYKRIDQ